MECIMRIDRLGLLYTRPTATVNVRSYLLCRSSQLVPSLLTRHTPRKETGYVGMVSTDRTVNV